MIDTYVSGSILFVKYRNGEFSPIVNSDLLWLENAGFDPMKNIKAFLKRAMWNVINFGFLILVLKYFKIF